MFNNSNVAKKISYIYHGDITSSNKPSSIQVLRMCEGIALAGYDITLITPAGKDSSRFENNSIIFRSYGIKKTYPLRLIKFFKIDKKPKLVRYSLYYFFSLIAVIYAKIINTKVIYARDPYTPLFAILLGIDFILEEHSIPNTYFAFYMRRLYYASKRLRCLIFISKRLKYKYQKLNLLSNENIPITVEHDAASPTQMLSLKDNSPVNSYVNSFSTIGYIGSLLPGRGIDIIIKLALRLKEHKFIIIGGTNDQISTWKNHAPSNILWKGFIEHGKLKDEYSQFNILLMPYQNDTETHGGLISTDYMSPLKLFEYMASGVPIISSDLPVLREVLTSRYNCLMVNPADINAWEAAVIELSSCPSLRLSLAKRAMKSIINYYNWERRAIRIMKRL